MSTTTWAASQPEIEVQLKIRGIIRHSCYPLTQEGTAHTGMYGARNPQTDPMLVLSPVAHNSPKYLTHLGCAKWNCHLHPSTAQKVRVSALFKWGKSLQPGGARKRVIGFLFWMAFCQQTGASPVALVEISLANCMWIHIFLFQKEEAVSFVYTSYRLVPGCVVTRLMMYWLSLVK